MHSFAIYALATHVHLILAFSVLTFAWDFLFSLTMVAVYSLLNVGFYAVFSRDSVRPSPKPDVSH